jgi:hypothetical protein
MERRKVMPKFTISWCKTYYSMGTEEIEASSEEEAIQIAKENIGYYEGHMEYDYDKNEIESLGEVQNNLKKYSLIYD